MHMDRGGPGGWPRLHRPVWPCVTSPASRFVSCTTPPPLAGRLAGAGWAPPSCRRTCSRPHDPGRPRRAGHPSRSPLVARETCTPPNVLVRDRGRPRPRNLARLTGSWAGIGPRRILDPGRPHRRRRAWSPATGGPEMAGGAVTFDAAPKTRPTPWDGWLVGPRWRARLAPVASKWLGLVAGLDHTAPPPAPANDWLAEARRLARRLR